MRNPKIIDNKVFIVKKIILDKQPIIFHKVILLIFIFITCGFQNPLNAMQVVAFYNCENFYDTTNQIIVNDEEFLPNSAKGYSASRYAQKTAQLGKVIFGLGQLGTKEGLALLGVAEIEKPFQRVIQEFTTLQTHGANIPLKSGEYKFTLRVENAAGSDAAEHSFRFKTADGVFAERIILNR